MKYLFISLLLIFQCVASLAQGLDFSRTLRVDYAFSGTDKTADISLIEMQETGPWAGRRANMDTLLLKGNGRITMRTVSSDEVLYVNSFSTLFQEWQTTEDATKVSRSFENVFLLPMPAEKARITVELSDVKGNVTASLTHEVNPADILIRPVGKVSPYRYLHRSGSAGEAIDVVIVAEGYRRNEMGRFRKDAREAMDALWSHEPFGSMKDCFNIIAVESASEDTGVSIPKKGEWKNTAVMSSYDTFYMDRYLTTTKVRRLHDLLAGIPYEHIIILANTDNYGGGGIYNAYTLTTAHHSQFRPVVVHEFGHSFGGLADEYYYDDMFVQYYYPGIEPWERNVTTLADFDSKWKDMVTLEGIQKGDCTEHDPLAVGLYEGAGYQSRGVYRANPDCRMKTNACAHFCPVCQEALRQVILYHLEDL